MAQEIPCLVCKSLVSREQYRVPDMVFIECGNCRDFHFICGPCILKVASAWSFLECPECEAQIDLDPARKYLILKKLGKE